MFEDVVESEYLTISNNRGFEKSGSGEGRVKSKVE